ncbi:hypothetical protein BSKO_10545 [Bryopsis sp. KO-2023]|nr:hypothetical protein BSKO_10545 [Bryopsis sp. KO-2023]
MHSAKIYSPVPIISHQNSDGITLPSFDLFSAQGLSSAEADSTAALFESCAPFCQDQLCKNQCIAVDNAIEHLQARTQNSTSNPGIVFIRMDFLAAASRRQPIYQELFQSALKAVKSNPRFLKYGHSDHAFICMVNGCDTVLSDMVSKTRFGKDTRAIWVGRQKDIERLAASGRQWPCRDRLLAAAGDDMTSVLVEVEKKIAGAHRWTCQGKWTLEKKKIGLLSMQCLKGFRTASRHRLVAVPIQKSGSSEMTALMRRIAGMPQWRDTHDRLIYGPDMDMEHVGRNWTFSEALENMEDPEWKRIIFVRDPVARFLSGYLNKVVALQQYHRVKWEGAEMPTIEQVVETFEAITPKERKRLDVHFRPQSVICNTVGRNKSESSGFWDGIPTTRFDFVARVESLDDDLKDMLTSMDLWESYGASGWGPNGDLALPEYDIYTRQRKEHVDTTRETHAAEKIHQYLTQDLIRRVQQLYQDDYDVFGFDRSTWIKPEKEL